MLKQLYKVFSPSEAAVAALPLIHQQVLGGHQSAESEQRSLGLDAQQPNLSINPVSRTVIPTTAGTTL